jgi:catechol 2,3-dioxygenase-like lactoylglutathione lyase family enzyme
MPNEKATGAGQLVLRGLHHVAYRCRDAAETTEFYTNVLGLKLAHTVKTDKYKGEYCPYLHIFFRMADGSYIAFFDMPAHDEQGWDANTPRWVQHLSLRVDDEAALQEAKRRLEARGIAIDGPRTGHTVRALYFLDPNGHRLELSVALQLDMEACEAEAQRDLEAWRTERQAYAASRGAKAA